MIVMTTTQYIVHFIADFVGLLPSFTFLIGCYFLWMHTYKISVGHKWFGLIAISLLLIFDVVLTLQEATKIPIADKFRPAANLGMTLWVVYNGWFFSKYPIPWKYLQAESIPARKNPYIPKTKIGMFLTRSPTDHPFYFTSRFRWVAVGFLFLLICAYFIQRLAYMAVESDQRVIAAQKTVEQRAVEAAKKTAKETTTAIVEPVKQTVDSLAEGQQKIVESAETTQKEVEAVKQETGQLKRNFSKGKPKTSGRTNPTVPVQPIRGKDIKTESKPWWDFGFIRIEKPVEQLTVDTSAIHLAKVVKQPLLY